MKYIYMILIVTMTALSTQAQSGSGSRKMIAVGLMALNSSTTQGGAGPSGSSILTRSEFIWAYPNYGFGALFDYDLHGSNEKDSAYGIKIEGYFFSSFYFELGYLISAKRAYTDRAIAAETGTGTVMGLGARFNIGGGGKTFFHASYKLKTQTLKQQDGVDLSEPIQQQDGYPVFGLGYSF